MSLGEGKATSDDSIDFLIYLRDLTREEPRYADRWNHLGIALASIGEHGEAVVAFDHAIAINRHFLEAQISRCFSVGEMGSVAEGFATLRRIHTRSPEDFATALPLAIYCMRHGWHEVGLEQLLSLEHKRPDLPFLHAYSASALFENGEDEAALQRMERARAELRALNFPVLAEGVEIELLGAEDEKKAPEVYRRWENPYLARVAMLRAHFLNRTQHSSTAIDFLVRANCRYPGNGELMVSMARLLTAQDRRDEARLWLESAVTLDPTSHQAHFELSFLHAEDDSPELAFEALRAALNARPLFPDYRYYLGILLLDIGMFDDAVKELERAVVLNSSYAHASLLLAHALVEARQFEKALDVISRSSAKDWPETRVLQARALQATGEDEEARAIVSEILEDDPANPDAQLVLESVTAQG